MKVVILAAGRGKRMGEWTDSKTKAMLPIKDVTSNKNNEFIEKPMLQITIEQFKNAGLKDFIIIVGYRKHDIIQYFGNGSKFGVTIKYATQHNPCAGTADAVGCANYFFEGYQNVTNFTNFFLVYGDVVPTTRDINSMFYRYINSDDHFGVMAVRTVDDPHRYGVVEIDDDDNILNIVEKSPNPPTNIINAGIYILPFEIFNCIKKTPLSERGEYELTTSIEMLIKNGIDMKAHQVCGFKDIGTKQIYENERESTFITTTIDKIQGC